jgi:hypothetical protein
MKTMNEKMNVKRDKVKIRRQDKRLEEACWAFLLAKVEGRIRRKHEAVKAIRAALFAPR